MVSALDSRSSSPAASAGQHHSALSTQEYKMGTGELTGQCDKTAEGYLRWT